MSGRGYVVVEGHGELRAAANLLSRLWSDLGLPFAPWADPIRGWALHTAAGTEKAVSLVRRKPDARHLLLLRDEDDACPAETGPLAASWVSALHPPFPVAVVLLRREFETLLLPSLHRMAGVPLVDPRGVSRPGVMAGTEFTGDAESIRDAKGEITRHWARGRYKPALDQLALTQLADFADIRAAEIASFGTLERALRFLASTVGSGVYPASLPHGR